MSELRLTALNACSTFASTAAFKGTASSEVKPSNGNYEFARTAVKPARTLPTSGPVR